MNPKIAIFYHGVFVIEGKLLEAAVPIIRSQMKKLTASGLLDACAEFHVGINGSHQDSARFVAQTIPVKAQVVYHGDLSRNENMTLRMLECWVSKHQGEDWFVFYFHSKGATKPRGDRHTSEWRQCMMGHLVLNWEKCVLDLNSGFDAVGVHWMTPPSTPDTQYIFGGNFWWSRLDFLETLPSILERDRIKVSGIHALVSRHEAEVFLCNGPRLPNVKDYHGPGWDPSKSHTCKQSALDASRVLT